MAEPSGSAWAPLRRQAFAVLWFAQLGANVGNWMQTVGAQWILVGHGAALVSLVQALSLAPVLFLSPLAGVLADTFDRRRLLYVNMGAMAVGMAALTVLTATTEIAPAALLTFTFLIGCGSALTSPAWQAIQPELVPREEIPAAAALSGMAVNGARAVGPAIAGYLVAAIGPAAVFGINALAFLGVAAAAFWWRRPRPERADAERLWPALAAGVRYVRAAPGVRRVMARSALFAVPGSALWALLPVAAQRLFGLGASGYGLLLGLLGVGAVGGVVLLPRLRSRFSDNAVMAGSAVVFAIGAGAAAVLPLPVAAALLVPAGAAWIGTLSSLNAAIQLSLPAWVRARGMAFYILVFLGAQSVGAFAWGLLADAIGVAGGLAVSAGALVLTAASVRWLPLLPGTGQFDRTPVADWGTPAVVFEPDPDDGPVQVSVAYRVPPENFGQFAAAMAAVGRSRRRTGAMRWRLYRDGGDPTRSVEVFVVRSWGEHLRQHEQRWTGADRDFHRAALALTDGTPPSVEHLLPGDIALKAPSTPPPPNPEATP